MDSPDITFGMLAIAYMSSAGEACISSSRRLISYATNVSLGIANRSSRNGISEVVFAPKGNDPVAQAIPGSRVDLMECVLC